jgi:hypothetical protein
VDLFELQVLDFIENILKLLKIDDEPSFKRRTTTNDTEINTSLISMGSFLPIEAIYDLSPLIPDDKKEEYLMLFKAGQLGMDDHMDDGGVVGDE